MVSVSPTGVSADCFAWRTCRAGHRLRALSETMMLIHRRSRLERSCGQLQCSIRASSRGVAPSNRGGEAGETGAGSRMGTRVSASRRCRRNRVVSKLRLQTRQPRHGPDRMHASDKIARARASILNSDLQRASQ